MKTLTCAKCHRTITVSDTYKFKQCSSCLSKQREKEKMSKMSKPSSFDVEVSNKGFMSFSDYQKHFKNATWKQFMESKAKYDEDRRIQSIPSEKHETIPIYNEVCRAVREMIMGLREKDSLVTGIHLSDCRLCQKWYSVYKEEHIVKMEGVNLWKDSEPQQETDAEKEVKLLNQILYQETFE